MNPGTYGMPHHEAGTGFISGLIPVGAGAFQAAAAHGLNGLPTKVRWVFVCLVANRGYLPGDEVDTLGVANSNGGIGCTPKADPMNVVLNVIAGNLLIITNDTQAQSAITRADWAVKCYASL